jgi:drug/metabolite transporter (DMT)-like permease
MPLYLFVPFFCAIVYALASLLFKRGYDEGAGTMESFHWSNLIGMPIFLPLFWLKTDGIAAAELWRPVLCAFIIYVSSWVTFLAMKLGDVSLVTPVLGTKVILVALFSVLLTQLPLSVPMGVACVLATVGVFLMSRSPQGPGAAPPRQLGLTLALCFGSSAGFGLTDVLIQMWADPYGGFRFLAIIPQVIGLFSLALLPWQARGKMRLPQAAWPWVGGAGVLLALQSLAMGIALGFFNDATGVNVVYSTRGLWSIVLVLVVGRALGIHERTTTTRQTMAYRGIGCILILAGVILSFVRV